MNSAGNIIVAVISGVIGLAILAVVLSNSANTSNVLTSGFTGLTNLFTAVLKPITGSGSIL